MLPHTLLMERRVLTHTPNGMAKVCQLRNSPLEVARRRPRNYPWQALVPSSVPAEDGHDLRYRCLRDDAPAATYSTILEQPVQWDISSNFAGRSELLAGSNETSDPSDYISL